MKIIDQSWYVELFINACKSESTWHKRRNAFLHQYNLDQLELDYLDRRIRIVKLNNSCYLQCWSVDIEPVQFEITFEQFEKLKGFYLKDFDKKYRV